jgi:hypothetical protein
MLFAPTICRDGWVLRKYKPTHHGFVLLAIWAKNVAAVLGL